jgi:hypothetical protein
VCEIRRAIKVCKDSGLEINKVEIGVDGRITLDTGNKPSEADEAISRSETTEELRKLI